MRAGEVKSPLSETSTTYSGIARGFAHNEQTHQDDDILLVVDFCLVEWARWARRRFHRLGYPGTTPEVQAGMGRRDKKSGTAPEPTHALAEAVEGVVVGLPDRLYEVRPGDGRDAILATAACRPVRRPRCDPPHDGLARRLGCARSRGLKAALLPP
mgnify:CR=1 FL=1